MIFDSIYFEINGKSLLIGIYLKIELGKICGLFGPNGSGKTTLIKIGAGILLPTTGTIFIEGEALIKKKLTKRYEKIAYLPQKAFLPRDIAVTRFLTMLPSKAKEYLLAHFPSKLTNRPIGSLSGGELRLLELIFVICLN